MMSEPTLIGVDLAGNDAGGNWSGKIEGVQIGDLAQFAGDPLDCTDPAWHTIGIAGLVLESHGHIQWHGNQAWDAIWLSLTDAARLINHLRMQHWTIIEGDARLFWVYDAGGAMTAAMLEEWM
jgi:hypothetical protein